MKKKRHGLYLPVELLDRLRVVASSRNSSVNRQIEVIIREWLELHQEEGEISRKAFLGLPLERRNEILRAQADKVVDYYNNPENIIGADTDFCEYD